MICLAASLAMVLGIASCAEELSDDKTYRPPKGEPGLGVSFESKYNRYQKGQKHPGQNNAWKVRRAGPIPCGSTTGPTPRSWCGPTTTITTA